MRTEDFVYMREALALAKEAFDAGEVPIGAVAVLDGTVIGRGRNRMEERRLPTAHAEMLAIEEACRAIGNWRLTEATLYTTLEPCVMCWGAIRNARIGRVVIGAREMKAGALSAEGLAAGRTTVEFGILEEESEGLLRRFFEMRRAEYNGC